MQLLIFKLNYINLNNVYNNNKLIIFFIIILFLFCLY